MRNLLPSRFSSVIIFKPVVNDMFDWHVGELGDPLGLNERWPELFTEPHVHRLARNFQPLGPLRQAVAGNLGEDVLHRVGHLVHDHRHLALEGRRQIGRQRLHLFDKFDVLFHGSPLLYKVIDKRFVNR